MRRYLIVMYFLLLFCVLLQAVLLSNEIGKKEKALQALRSKDYSTAIKTCLSQLKTDPENYYYNFILSQSYAFSRQWDQALDIIDRMLNLHPLNTDLLLFKSRILSWKEDYEEAEYGYREVLRLNPNDIDAMKGLAEITSWKKKYPEAIEKYQRILKLEPDNAEIYFRIGSIYLWDGNCNKAKENFRKAINFDPENEKYKSALNKVYLRFEEKSEIRYQHKIQSFSDKRNNYLDRQLVFNFKIPQDLASLLLKYNQTKRFNEWDVQYGIELYPRLWARAYGYFDFNYSPKAIHYPYTSYLVEIYQALFSSTEVSLGYRRMNFRSNPVSIYLGSLGYYVGKYYSFFRWYYTPKERGNFLSWILNIRRYFSKDNYLFIGYGQGSRPFEVITLEDLLVSRSWIFLAGFDWYFLKRIKLQFFFSHRNEKGDLKRNTFFVITGYRW